MNALRERVGQTGLIQPEGIRSHKDSRPPYYGKFIIEPLERGFGITIGNALRRILLSSIPGAAITAVRIDGAPHEFTSLPGILEDVTDIILNLKGVRFRLKGGEGPFVFRLEKKGEGEVKAGDIETDGLAEVVNPDHHIATLTKDGRLVMELQVEKGKGYVPAEFPREGYEIGIIPVDAIFSPITRVNFTVTQARVGKSSDFDRLVMEIWTDGTIDPEEALKQAARILREQLLVFGEEPEVRALPPEKEEPKIDYTELLNRTLEELEISSRSINCLRNAGIRYVGDLVTRTETEMLRIKNFGRKSLEEIRDRLKEMGLSFGMDVDWNPPEEKEERG